MVKSTFLPLSTSGVKVSFLWSCCRFCCGRFFWNHNMILEERDEDGVHMWSCRVAFQGAHSAAVGCALRVCFRRILSQLGTGCVSIWKHGIKSDSTKATIFIAPLLHQRNNRLIQRLQIWPRRLNHTNMGGGHGSAAHALTNSNKQRDTEQTLTPNTPVRTTPVLRRRCRRRAQAQIPACVFPQEFEGKSSEPHLQRPKEKMTPSICSSG